VRDVAGFDDPLTGAKVPPEIGIEGVARRHRQQAEQEIAANAVCVLRSIWRIRRMLLAIMLRRDYRMRAAPA